MGIAVYLLREQAARFRWLAHVIPDERARDALTELSDECEAEAIRGSKTVKRARHVLRIPRVRFKRRG